MKKTLQNLAYGGAFALFTMGATNGYSQCVANFSVDITPISCNGSADGELVVSSTISGGDSPIMISEVDFGSPDFIEVTNVSGSAFDPTGYYVIASNSYTDINLVNPTPWYMSGVIPTDGVDYRNDLTGTNYYGSNLFFNPGDPGWAAIIDGNNGHQVVDIVFWGWSTANIGNFAPIVSGNPISYAPADWIGDGVNAACVNSIQRSTNNENNDLNDWTCATISTGVLNMTITPQGTVGAPLVSQAWSTGSINDTISGLLPNTYIVNVVDSIGCTGSDTIVLTEPAAITTTPTTTGITCNGDGPTGTASLVATGGTGTLTVDWGAANSMALDSGYTIYTVTDSNFCVYTDSVFISEPAAISSIENVTNVSCSGGTDGMVVLTHLGGTGPMTEDWMGNDPTMLAAGNYVYTLTDSLGCTFTDLVSVTEPVAIALSATVTDVMVASDGTIDLTVTGGTAPYTYAWTPSGSGEDPTGLDAGVYSVTVTDANGCTETLSVTVGSQVGIVENGMFGIEMYPNPNNGSFQLSMDQVNPGNYSLTVYSVTGQVVFSSKLDATITTIHTGIETSGVYIVRLSDGTNEQLVRMTVQ